MSIADDLAEKYDGKIVETIHWRVRGPSSGPAPSGVYAISYESAEAAEAEARRDAPLCGVDIEDCVLLEVTEWVKVSTVRKLESYDSPW